MAIQPRTRHGLRARRRPGARAAGNAAPRSARPGQEPAQRHEPEVGGPFAHETATSGAGEEPAVLDLELERELGDLVRAVDLVASGATRWVMLAGLRRAAEAIALAGETGRAVSLRLDTPTSILVRRDGD